MLIQTLPPRRMCRVMAIRALSICRLVTYAGSRAWMPHSPNVTAVPPLAAPERSGWCCLRCLTRRGMSISSTLRCVRLGRGVGLRLAGRGSDGGRGILPDALAGRVAAAVPALAATGTATAALAAGRTLAARRTRGRGLLAGELALRDVTLVDPDLDADAAERRPGL